MTRLRIASVLLISLLAVAGFATSALASVVLLESLSLGYIVIDSTLADSSLAAALSDALCQSITYHTDQIVTHVLGFASAITHLAMTISDCALTLVAGLV